MFAEQGIAMLHFMAGLAFMATALQTGGFIESTGTAVARPVGEVHLDSTSGSYFQVFEFYGKPPHTWEHAARMVKGYRHEGREGRLAHIKSNSTHFFLLLNFDELRTFKMWTGLRVLCEEKRSVPTWLDGSPLSAQTFRAWQSGEQPKYSRECKRPQNRFKELPVYYEPGDFGIRWKVGDRRTNINQMMVEFPDLEEE